jgi:hypothetical protein
MMLRHGDIANIKGDLYLARTSPPLACGKILLPFRKAFRAMQHGWRWKAAIADPQTGVVEIWVERGGQDWKVRGRIHG